MYNSQLLLLIKNVYSKHIIGWTKTDITIIIHYNHVSQEVRMVELGMRFDIHHMTHLDMGFTSKMHFVPSKLEIESHNVTMI
jgi:hypothetical protein